MKKNNFLLLSTLLMFSFSQIWCFSQKKPKIIALMQVRNEEVFIAQTLLCLEPYVDAIIILDDASTDQTLSIVKSLAEILPIACIIENSRSAWEYGNESDNQTKLLNAGRKLGGTHFIIIDADEIFSANCLENNYLRKQILALNPGEKLALSWVQLWKSTKEYNVTKSGSMNPIIFCDKPSITYANSFLHGSRLPYGLEKEAKYLSSEYVLLHFQFVNWRFLLVKQAWYRCLEHIRNPNKPIRIINDIYGCTVNEAGATLRACPSFWFNAYDTLNLDIYECENTWREKQVLEWFLKYGLDYFKDLDIWNIDWGAGLKEIS